MITSTQGAASTAAPSETDIAWAAGLFEGEGCVGSYDNGRGSFRLRLYLGTTDLDVITRFAHIIGHMRIGAKRDHRARNKSMYQVQVTRRAEVERILLMFEPYLGGRRHRQACHALWRAT